MIFAALLAGSKGLSKNSSQKHLTAWNSKYAVTSFLSFWRLWYADFNSGSNNTKGH